MIQTIKRAEPPTEVPEAAGTWLQITFTLSPEHYRLLWQRAEYERRTIPAVVRDVVVDSLQISDLRFVSKTSNHGSVIHREV